MSGVLQVGDEYDQGMSSVSNQVSQSGLIAFYFVLLSDENIGLTILFMQLKKPRIVTEQRLIRIFRS